jgi:hypothetical protein
MTRIAWIAGGVLVWALHFGALYGFTALACARGFANTVPWFAGFAALAALFAMLLIIARNVPRRAEFESWMALAVAALASVGIAYGTFSVYLVRPCA